jgi:hypothetical protein
VENCSGKCIDTPNSFGAYCSGTKAVKARDIEVSPAGASAEVTATHWLDHDWHKQVVSLAARFKMSLTWHPLATSAAAQPSSNATRFPVPASLLKPARAHASTRRTRMVHTAVVPRRSKPVMSSSPPPPRTTATKTAPIPGHSAYSRVRFPMAS